MTLLELPTVLAQDPEYRFAFHLQLPRDYLTGAPT
jgi:hypothetical protein